MRSSSEHVPVNNSGKRGFDSENVFTVRTVEDIIALREIARGRQCCIMVGGGLLGIEIAHALCSLGLEVTVVEYFDRLIPRQLDEEGSHLLKEMLQKKGLKFILGAQSTAIKDVEGEKHLIIKGEQTLCCEFIVMSVGIRPVVTLACDAGLTVARGIVVDNYLRTSNKDIFAAGDCAEHNGIIYGLWSVAMEQGDIAGGNMVAPEREYEGTTTSTMIKVAGIELASIGTIDHEGDDSVSEIKKTDVEANYYKKFFLKDKQVCGAILIGCGSESMKIKKLIHDKVIIENPESLL
ncbi:NAD(P)/FAD-dependent oxidoreductase [Candidatus Omnitrophota bacterium]